MSVVLGQWNGNKFGESGDYGPWRAEQVIGSADGGGHLYAGGTYEGHNIAALAVDGEGRVEIDFDFNHNNAFDSSAEHAESRLVRRVFSLDQVYAPWAAPLGAGADAAETGPGRRGRCSQRRLVRRLRPKPPVW